MHKQKPVAAVKAVRRRNNYRAIAKHWKLKYNIISYEVSLLRERVNALQKMVDGK